MANSNTPLEPEQPVWDEEFWVPRSQVLVELHQPQLIAKKKKKCRYNGWKFSGFLTLLEVCNFHNHLMLSKKQPW